jgi:hypothetical protein
MWYVPSTWMVCVWCVPSMWMVVCSMMLSHTISVDGGMCYVRRVVGSRQAVHSVI